MPLPLLTSPLLQEIPGLLHGFTTREGGVSTGSFASLNLGRATGDDDQVVDENYRILGREIGIPPERILGIRQVHGAEIVPVRGGEDFGNIYSHNGDGLITDLPNISLCVRVADCLPVLAVDPRRRVIGVAHAGWRGTLAGVVPRLVGALRQQFGSAPGELVMALGPCIRLCCFEVSIGIASLFEAQTGLEVSEVRSGEVSAHLDLEAINTRLARQAGVRADRIWRAGACTKCDAKRFYSYRRDGKHSGRSVGLLAWQ